MGFWTRVRLPSTPLTTVLANKELQALIFLFGFNLTLFLFYCGMVEKNAIISSIQTGRI